jgi:hypothetical protein
VILILAGEHGIAQNAIGLKAGVNYNYLGYSFEPGYGDRFGHAYGAFGLIEVIPRLYLNPEINFSRKSLDLYRPNYLNEDWTGNTVRLRLNYIDIPLNIGYGMFIEPEQTNIRSFLLLYGGAQINLLYDQKNSLISEETTPLPEIEQINSPDIGFNLGISLSAGNFYFDMRYFLALTRFVDHLFMGNNMNTMTLSVGYMLVFN